MKYLIIFIFLCGFQQMKAQETEINWIGFEELEESLKKEPRKNLRKFRKLTSRYRRREECKKKLPIDS